MCSFKFLLEKKNERCLNIDETLNVLDKNQPISCRYKLPVCTLGERKKNSNIYLIDSENNVELYRPS